MGRVAKRMSGRNGGEGAAEEDEEEKVKWAMHYSSLHQMLLVGEGDFSFSLSLATAFLSAVNIVATSLDSYGTLLRKYSKAQENVEKLKKMGATVLHEVDATKMKLVSDLSARRFDRIVFNFPHAGFKGKEDEPRLIRLHRELVRGFFRNASRMLRPYGEIHVTHKTNAPFCHWNLVELASINSLFLVESANFNIKDYPGYSNKRGDGSKSDDCFPLGECTTFKFIIRRQEAKRPVKDNNLLLAAPPIELLKPSHFDISYQDSDFPFYAPRIPCSVTSFPMEFEFRKNNSSLWVSQSSSYSTARLETSMEYYLKLNGIRSWRSSGLEWDRRMLARGPQWDAEAQIRQLIFKYGCEFDTAIAVNPERRMREYCWW